MPNSIDERIVEMQFDNKNFEKNIKQSLKSLEQLDKALEMKDAAKGFENLEHAANSVDLSKLERAAEVIEKRFSTAGIAGAAVVNRAVNGLINGVVGLGKSVVNLAKTGGIARAMKLEHASFMLNGLLKDEKLVADMINGPISKSVKGTAYGLDAAANAAAQFAASGITGMEELETALTAVSGVASMTGSEFEDIGSIFTTVAGQGKIMTRQFRQIEARGLNAAAAIAKYLNTTESAVREMTKEGEISFEIFSNAMNEAFGDQAKKANETFDGALRNTKAALSRIGAKVATPAFETLRKVLVSLIDVIDKVNDMLSGSIIKSINSLIIRFEALAVGVLHQKKFFELLEGIVGNIIKLFDMLASWVKPVRDAFRNVFPRTLLDNLKTFTDLIGKVLDALTMTREKAVYLEMTLTGILDILDLVLMAVESVLNLALPGIGKLFKGADSLSTKMLKLTAYIGYFVDKFHDFVKEGKLAQTIMKALSSTFGDTTSIITGVTNALGMLLKGIAVAAIVVVSVIKDIVLAAKNLAVYFYQLEPVQKALEQIGQVLAFIGDKLLSVLKVVLSAAGKFLNIVHKLAQGDVASIFSDLNNALKPTGKLLDAATIAFGKFFDLFRKNKDTIESVVVKPQKNMANVVNAYGARSFELTKGGTSKELVGQTKVVVEAQKNWASFSETVENSVGKLISAGTLFSVAFGAVVIIAAINIAKAIGRLSRAFRSVGRLADSVAFFMQSLAVGVNAFALGQLASAIVMIAGAIFLLTKFTDPKALLITTGAMIALVGAMAFIVNQMKHVDFKSIANFSSVASGFISFAGAILILVVAVKQIYDIAGNTTGLIKSVGAILVLLAALTAVGIAMGTFGMRKMVAWKGGLALIEMAAALYVMAKSLQKMGEVDLDKAYKALPLISAILAEFALIMFASSVTFSPTAGLGALGIVAAIVLLFRGLEPLKKIDPEVLEQAKELLDKLGQWLLWALGFIAGIKALEAIESGFTWAAIKIQGITSGWKSMFVGLNKGIKHLGDAAAIATIVVGAGAAIWLIADAIAKIGKIPPEELKRGGLVTALIGVAVGALVVVIAKMGVELGKHRKATEAIRDTMISISALLLSMAAALYIIGNIPRDNLVRAGNAVALMTVVMAGLIGVLSFVRAKIGPMATVSVATIGALSLFLISMTAALGILSLIAKDNDSYNAAIVGLLAVAAGMALVFAALGQMAAFTAPAAVAVGLISVLVLSIAGAFKIIETVDYNAAKANITLLGECLGALSIVVGLLGFLIAGTGGAATAVIAQAELLVGGLVGIIALMGKAGQELAKIDPNGLKGLFQAMADGIQIFADAVSLLGSRILSPEWKELVTGAAGLWGLTAVLSVFVPVAGAFALVAVGFGLACALAGGGFYALGAGLQMMQNVDMTLIADQITRLAQACSSIALYGPGLVIAGAGLVSFGAGLAVFDLAAIGAIIVLETLAKANFEGLSNNFKELASACREFMSAWVQIAGAVGLFAAFGLACYVVAGGVIALSLALGVLSVALYAVSGALTTFVDLFKMVVDAVKQVADSISTASDKLTNLGRNTVQQIYAALISGADQMLKDAGDYMINKVAEGFEEGYTEAFKNRMDKLAAYIASGFQSGINNQSSQIKNSGTFFAITFLDAFELKMGISSPSKKMAENAAHSVKGWTNGISKKKGAIQQTGIDFANWFGIDLNDTLSGYINSALSMVQGLIDAIRGAKKEAADAAAFKINYGEWVNKDKSGGYYGGKGITRQDLEDSRKKGREQIQQAAAQVRANKAAAASAAATNLETGALGGNTKAAKANTKAKEENEEANDGKTEAIDEETESLGEETEAGVENEEELRAMAEAIEVVTEKYKELNAWVGTRDNKFKIARNQFKALGGAWSHAFKDISRSSNGTEKTITHTVGEIASYFNEAKKTVPKTANKIAKGLYAFDAATNNLDKKMTKRVKNISSSEKSIGKAVQKTGATIAKVYEGYAKIYTKVGGGKTEKMTIRLTKNVKNLGKRYKEASDFVKNFNDNVNSAQYVEDLTDNLRKIENFFVKRSNMPKKVQNYLGTILSNFNKDFKYSMNILAKNIDGIGDYWKKGTQSTAYVADAFTQLAATLYDGSEAANQYWTEIAQMQFLVEHGLESPDKLDELYSGYLTRAVEALKEYKKTLDETIAGQFNPFEEFDEKLDDQSKNLLSNIESQIRGFERWGEGLNALAARGADFNLMKELADQGVESYGIMKNLLSMTASELALYNKYYRMIDTVKQKASDAALAAVANARTQASLRAASKSGKISQKQIEQSRNIAKRSADDIKSVAHAEVYYNNMTKKQEKEYLKTLNKKEKAKYKEEKRQFKLAKKEEERLAKEEQARREEEYRVETIMKTVEGYDSLIKVIDQYANDANVMAKVNEKLDDSFKGVYKNIGKSAEVTKAWLKFADQLGAEGEDADSYFSSLQSTISSFRDGIKDALYEVTRAFTKFEESTEKISMPTLFANSVSQVRAATQFGNMIEKAANMGFNTHAIEYIGKRFAQDQAGAINELRQWIQATRQQITNINGEFASLKAAQEKAMKQTDQSVVRAQQDPQKAAFEAAERRYKAAQENLQKLTESERLNGEEMRKLYRVMDKQSYSGSVEVAAITTGYNSTRDYYNNIQRKLKQQIEEIARLSGVSTKAKLDAIKKLQNQYNYYDKDLSRYNTDKRRIEDQIKALKNAGVAENDYRIKSLQQELNKLNEKYKDTIPGIIADIEAKYQAELKAAQAESAAATAAYNKAKAEWEAEQALRARLEAERKAQEQFEIALMDLEVGIEKFDELTAAIGKVSWSADYLRRTYVKLKDALVPVNKALEFAKKNFAEFDGNSKSILKELNALDEGFYRLASTLEETNDESGTFIDRLGKRLENYRKTLYDTIKGQVQLFDEFKKYSGEDATTADTYLDNMASQINGLSEWLTNLETLARRGVSGDILQMFATEGQNSFEKVAAFAKATDSQLGELISQYKKYISLTDEAADRALAAIGASYTDKAQEAAAALEDVFKSSGAQRIKEAAYEAGAMVITGVKDGIGHEMPSIISAVEKTADEVTSKLASGISASAVTGAVVAGLNDVDKAIAATMSVTLGSFYDSITQQAVDKFKMAVDEINQYVTEQLATEYTITIHVDTSEIDAAVARMNAAIAMTNASAGQTSQAYTASQQNQTQATVVTPPVAPSNTTNITLNQTNNSPKALSQVEIYRDTQSALNQTRNLIDLAQMGG